MEITACPKCGSRRIFQGRLKEGVLTGYTTKYVCRDCGYQGFPFIFDSEEEYKKFFNQIKKEKTKEKKEYISEEIEDSKKPMILKNITTKLGLSLVVAGILITAATGSLFLFLTGLLILDGIILFIVGLIAPKKEELKNKTKKLEKYPKYAGMILIISGIIFLLYYIMLLLFFFNLDSLPLDQQTVYLSIKGYMINIIIMQISFCLISMIGGFFSIFKKRWEVAILGGILGTLVLIPFYVGTIVSLVALILLSFSRPLFKSRKNI